MGQMIGRYPVSGVIGAGGFGTVYAGTDPVTGESVAIKVLDWPDQDWRRAMFRHEATALLAINHPNVVRVRDVIDEPGLAALVTDLIDGASLRTVLKASGPLTGPQALAVLAGALDGLAAVHAVGLVHADLKPENILIDRSGTSRLIDFGLAAPPGPLAGPDAWIGTPAYMAPERVLGTFQDARTDLYSTAVVLFELLCGRVPIDGPDPLTTAHLQVTQPPPDLASYVRDLAPGLGELTRLNLAKDPAYRHQNAAAFARSLRHAASSSYGPAWLAAGALSATVGAVLATVPGALGILGSAPVIATNLGAAGMAGIGAAGAASAHAAAGGAGAGAAGATGAGSATVSTAAAVGGAKAAIVAGALAVAAVGGGGAAYVVTHESHHAAPAVVHRVDRIAYFRCAAEDHCALYTASPDGSDERRLASISGSPDSLSWSASGTSLVYAVQAPRTGSAGSSTSSLMVTSADGTTSTRIASGRAPRWSPDGTQVVFYRCVDDACATVSLERVDADGTNDVVLDPSNGGPASWSPDGSRIAYTRFEDGIGGCGGIIAAQSFRVINADGTAEQSMTVDAEADEAPGWVAGTDQLLITGKARTAVIPRCGNAPDTAIDVVDPHTGKERELAARAYGPVSSPDGSQVAYTTAAGNTGQIHVRDIDGGDDHVVASGPSTGLGAGLDWSPDGTSVVYGPGYSGDAELWVAQIGTGRPRLLAQGFDGAWGSVPVGLAGAAPPAVRPTTAAAVQGLLIPPKVCGEDPSQGWYQPDPIQLIDGKGEAFRYESTTWTDGAGITATTLVGTVDLTGDGVPEVVLDLDCTGTPAVYCCAGTTSIMDVVAVFDVSHASPRQLGRTIWPTSWWHGGSSYPRIIASARLTGSTIVTDEQLAYAGDQDTYGRRATTVRHTYLNGRWR